MSVPEGTGPRWPLRTTGFVLLGLAAVATLTGLVLVATDDAPPAAGTRDPVASESAPGSRPALPSVLTAPPVQDPAGGPPPGPPVASGTAGAPVPGPAAGPAVPAPPASDAGAASSGTGPSRGATRVYNNSTVRGLASRAADDLTAAGFAVVEVGNYSGGRIPTTTVYYQEGTGQRGTAEAIATEFGMRVQPRFAGIANAEPGLIVIVTNDYGA